ncbi:hypothetical protein [Streptomyces sp. NPDC088246]|uniref:hypothetical protein n=1 Tax=Streptomyces sp. NPDC088246 TaxID=3365842 RepID=UPI0037F69777
MTALVGPSGSGKSTLLAVAARCCAPQPRRCCWTARTSPDSPTPSAPEYAGNASATCSRAAICSPDWQPSNSYARGRARQR